jgi:hypothetical protein
MGKGSNPRPFEVDHKTFSNNFDAIFRKDKSKVEPPADKQEKTPLDPEKTKDTK